MSVIRLQNVTMSFEQKLILRDVYLRLAQGERLGLIGKNGVGKTTVLRLILGQVEPDSGTVDVEPGARIGYFSQFSELDADGSILDLLDGVFVEIHRLESDLDRVNAELAGAETDRARNELMEQQARLLGEMEHREGWTYRNRIDTVLTKLGFSETHRGCPISQLSGGWRNRAALAKILIEEPDLLLMDEPTNFLDIEGLSWLEQWCRKLRGGLILVSHDRHFLENVVTRIVEIENYHFQLYDGTFTQYIREKKLRLRTLQNQFAHEEELLVFEAEAIATRREAARDPGDAQRRQLANIKKRIEPRPLDKIVTSIYQGLKIGNALCRVEDLGKAHGDQILFLDVSFGVNRGDRIAIVGPNGCGKTTLIQAFSGQSPADTGTVSWIGSAECCSFNEILDGLDPDDTVTHAVNIFRLAFRAPRKVVNRFLSLFQFSEMDLKQKIGTLSGGQRARVALAKCLLSGAAVIVLDEPTNHLDMTSTQVMERALINFPGAVVVVSHDRFFIDKVATHLLVFVGDGEIQRVDGNWTIWRNSARG